MTASRFTTTHVEHPDCAECVECVTSAEIHAAITGSTGATYSHDNSRIGKESHSATVRRVQS